MSPRIQKNRFALINLITFGVVFLLCAIRPFYRHDWLLENVIVFPGVPALVLMHRYLTL